MDKKIIFVDIDGVLCDITGNYDTVNPIQKNIDYVNNLFENNTIILWTARGRKIKRQGLYKLTVKQLEKWGVKYHKLLMNKPFYDIIIDDKSFDISKI